MPPFCRASELDRLLACPGSLVLPTRESPTGAAAEWGNFCHSWMETGRVGSGSAGETLKRKLKASGVSRTKLWPSEGQHEIALAWNVVERRSASATGLSKGETKTWREGFGDEWVTGSADFAMTFFGSAWVDDLKTGRYGDWDKYAAQQTFYCLAYAHSQLGSLAKTRSTITHWPKYPLAEPPARNERLLSVEDLSCFSDRLVSLREHVLGLRQREIRPDDLTPGGHCRFCPAQGACPAYEGNQ